MWGLEFEKARGNLADGIANLCTEHAYLSESDKVDAFDEEVFRKLRAQTANNTQLENSLLTLTRMMHAHYGRPAILLVDEYDVPLAKAHEADLVNDYYPRMLDTIRGLMSSAFKTSPHLKFAVITGCLRSCKESIFTGMNNFMAYSIPDERFSEAFGFTGEEVEMILREAGLADRMELVREWYDGYIFGSSEIFGPWYVACYVKEAAESTKTTPGNYWKNTSGNGIVDEFVGHENFGVSDKFETLMNGESIEQTICSQLTCGELTDKEDHLWSVFYDRLSDEGR